MITVVNKHHDSSGVYVGRPTVLGNPYTLKEYNRTDAIARYRICCGSSGSAIARCTPRCCSSPASITSRVRSRSCVGVHHGRATPR